MRAEEPRTLPDTSRVLDHPRATEVALWRAALALGVGNDGIDEARGDEAMIAVARHTPRPQHASEVRLLGVVIESMSGPGERSVEDTAWRLVRVGGVRVEDAARALGMDEAGSLAAIAGVDARTDPGVTRAWQDRVAAADWVRALARVDARTAGLRRRRARINALKFIAYVAALGLVAYAMFDLRRAADAEREKRTPADIYSLPMPKKQP